MDGLYSRRQVLKNGGAALCGLGMGSMIMPKHIFASGMPVLSSLGEVYSFPSWWPEGKRSLEEAPETLVDAAGKLRLGFFKRPVRNVNMADANIFGDGRGRKRALKQLKEHIGYGVAHPDAYFSLIIMDFQTMAVSGFYSYDRIKNRFFEHRAMVLDSGNFNLADTTWGEDSFIQSGGYSLKFEHRLEEGYHRILIDMAETKKAPPVMADFTLKEDLNRFQSQVLCIPMMPRNFMYSHKTHMPAEGWIKVADKEYRLDPGRDKSGMDEHKGYYVMETSYCWSAVAARDASGKMIGMNVTENANFFDPDIWNENCIWVDKKQSLIGAVHFEYDEKDPTKPWRIYELNGRMDLEFIPEAKKEESLNLIIASINYYQQCGRFNGFLVDDSGDKHKVENFFGVAEKFDSIMRI